jgi:hypothetical protein
MISDPCSSDWFRLETMDDSLQPTIDMLLNLAVFMWFGAVCPWPSFLNNDIIPLYRLVFLGILILIVRRLPIVLAMHKYIHQIEHISQACFVGFFGPIGVGAIFYLSISREFLLDIKVDGKTREDAQRVADAVNIVVWFLVICSIVSFLSPRDQIRSDHPPKRPILTCSKIVHGLSVPIGKAGYNLPRTISSAISTSIDEPEPVPISNSRTTHSTAIPLSDDSFRSRKRGVRSSTPNPPIFRIGRSVIHPPANEQQPGAGQTDEPERPVHLVIHDSPALSSEGVEASEAHVV